jgi:hypothetical protein
MTRTYIAFLTIIPVVIAGKKWESGCRNYFYIEFGPLRLPPKF